MYFLKEENAAEMVNIHTHHESICENYTQITNYK